MVEKVIRPPTLTSAVAEKIREAIFRGDLQPGAPLREIELSKSLEISRGTVREALRILVDEGLIDVETYRCAYVARLTPEKAKEIYTLRGVLEGYAVRLALENSAYTTMDFEILHGLVNRMGELDEAGNVFEVLQTDMHFHMLICERSNHRLLLNVLGNLQSQSLLFILNTKLYQSDFVKDDISHQAILDALRGGDPSIGEEIMRKHIYDNGIALLERMKVSDLERINL
jgi:DNA-binding GntR family transcriptional regulator